MTDVILLVAIVLVKMVDPLGWVAAILIGGIAATLPTQQARWGAVLIGAATAALGIAVLFPTWGSAGFHWFTWFLANTLQIGIVLFVIHIWRRSRAAKPES
jgi:hypothetical protein